MTKPWMWRLVVVMGVTAMLAGPGWAGASRETFERATDVDRYLNQGEVHAATLQMLRDVAVALHQEHEALTQELGQLRDEVNQLTQEVRRLAAEKAR